MDDEKIIGPFTFRQFIYLALGVGIMFFVNDNFSQSITIGAGIVVASLTFLAIKQAEPPPFNEAYIRTKKSELGPEEFRKLIQRKIAMITSQMAVLEAKGLSVDPAFTKMKEFLEKTLEE